MQINLLISRYKFEYLVQDDLSLPRQHGVFWHSVLGKSLLELSCVSENIGDCGGCMFTSECDYIQLFTGDSVSPLESKVIRGHNYRLAPHIFRTNLSDRTEYKMGDILKVEISLCENANSRLSSLVSAMHALGLRGVGKKRSRIQLQQVTQQLEGSEKKLLLSGFKLVTPEPSQFVSVPPAPFAFTMKFLTPYKSTLRDGDSRGIDFSRLLMAVIRRVSLFYSSSTGLKLKGGFRALKKLTETIEVVNFNSSFHSSEYFSLKDRGTKNISSGFIGDVTFNLEKYEALWPYIVIGESLNVGKNASMGFGRYCILNV